MMQGVNAHLREMSCDDVAVTSIEVANDDFHARYSAKRKTYLYRVYVSPTPSPLRDELYHQIYKMPDLEKMREFVRENFLGVRDFSAYAAKSDKNPIREIYRFEVEQHDDEILFWITGNGFLHKQIRLMVGQLLEGKRKAVPAKGLTLWCVEY